jgi:hypothetical protein
MHVVAVVRCKPHEVRRGNGVQIINQDTIFGRATVRVCQNKFGASSAVGGDVGEEDEWVVFWGIGLVVVIVATTSNRLVLHIPFP